jgi:hypothetical protein
MPSFSANSGTVIPSISKILKISDNIDKQSRAPEKSHHASRRFLTTGGGGKVHEIYGLWALPEINSVCPQSRLLCGQTLHFLA